MVELVRRREDREGMERADKLARALRALEKRREREAREAGAAVIREQRRIARLQAASRAPTPSVAGSAASDRGRTKKRVVGPRSGRAAAAARRKPSPSAGSNPRAQDRAISPDARPRSRSTGRERRPRSPAQFTIFDDMRDQEVSAAQRPRKQGLRQQPPHRRERDFEYAGQAV